MTDATDRREACRMDGKMIASNSLDWPRVPRLQRAGLVRAEVQDRHHATIWATIWATAAAMEAGNG